MAAVGMVKVEPEAAVNTCELQSPSEETNVDNLFVFTLYSLLSLMTILKMSTKPPAAVKVVAVIGSKVGAGAAMEGARRARQAKKIKPWSEIELGLKVKLK